MNVAGGSERGLILAQIGSLGRRRTCAASHPNPLEQRTQPCPLVGAELVAEQQYVASRATSKIEPDPIGAYDRSRPERSGTQAPFGNEVGRVCGHDDRRGRPGRQTEEGVGRNDREQPEPRRPRQRHEQVGGNQQQVQRAPPYPNEMRRPRRQNQSWPECAR
jgi:hypothetical protein